MHCVRAGDAAAATDLVRLYEPAVRRAVPRIDGLKAGTMRQLAHGPLSVGLHHLILSGGWLAGDPLADLVDSPLADSLVTLSLSGWWHPLAVAAIAASPRLGRLRNLDLGLLREGLAALAGWPMLPRLHRLRISDDGRRDGSAPVAALREILGDRLIVG